jgi:hypothetical protein
MCRIRELAPDARGDPPTCRWHSRKSTTGSLNGPMSPEGWPDEPTKRTERSASDD